MTNEQISDYVRNDIIEILETTDLSYSRTDTMTDSEFEFYCDEFARYIKIIEEYLKAHN